MPHHQAGEDTAAIPLSTMIQRTPTQDGTPDNSATQNWLLLLPNEFFLDLASLSLAPESKSLEGALGYQSLNPMPVEDRTVGTGIFCYYKGKFCLL